MGRICQGFLQCLLKLVNFVLILVGLSMIIYSLWMLNDWDTRKHHTNLPPSPLPGPDAYLSLADSNRPSYSSGNGFSTVVGRPYLFKAIDSLDYHRLRDKLPEPWFIYAFFGMGILVIVVTFLGHIAAETSSGCGLCFYAIFLMLLLVAQTTLAGIIFFDKHWEQEMPEDPTGEFENIKSFVMDHLDVCRWVALGVVIVQAVALLLALLLRSVTIGAQRVYDSDGEFIDPRSRSSSRAPLLVRQPNQGNPAPVAAPDNRPPRTDTWSTRMREKYGLDTTQFSYNPLEGGARTQQASSMPEEKSRCAIM